MSESSGWERITIKNRILHRSRAPASLTERAYVRIRDDILRCQLPPNAEVTESQLCARLRSSKAPVRAALARLVESGLVAPVRRRGYIIAPITVRHVRDLFEARALIERHIALRAAGRIDPVRLQALSDACDIAAPEDGRGRGTAFLEANRRFHLYIAEAAGNQRLATMLDGLLSETFRALHLGVTRRADLGAHLPEGRPDLVRALIANDGVTAARLAGDHIEAVRAMVVEALLADADYDEAPPRPKPAAPPSRRRAR